MRWLLQELASRHDAIGARKQAVSLAGRAHGGAAGLISSVADAAERASEVASNVASDVTSELAASAVSNSRATATLDSATALPSARTGLSGREGAVDALEAHSAAVGDHLQPPRGLWHGHGGILMVLVGLHLAAFLYWVYLYVIARKYESRRTDQTRRVVKPFKVVYEWGLDTATAITSAMRKKQAASPAASPRVALTTLPPKPPAGGMQRSSSGFSLNKLIKGRTALS